MREKELRIALRFLICEAERAAALSGSTGGGLGFGTCAGVLDVQIEKFLLLLSLVYVYIFYVL